MQSPFLFGKTVSDEEFTNRVKELKRLKSNFENHINTILISPRRWGKSSLVKKVSADIQSRTVKVVMLDLFGIRNEEEFFKEFATATIKATTGKLEEWIHAGKEFLKNIRPVISISTDPANSFDLSLDWKIVETHYKEILELPEAIGKAKNLDVIVCIDEFQNLASFTDPKSFQKRLRSVWQHHQHATYCLYGSRQHMMSELFEKQSNAFYKFGEVIYLPKIDRQDWISYITGQFAKTKKTITTSLAAKIAELVKDHSYYVQQLSHLLWIITEKTADESGLANALDDLLSQNALLYMRDTEQLTAPQLNFLKALASGVSDKFSSKYIITEYQLGTSANVLKIKKALVQKELIDDQAGQITFLDPVYELWVKKNLLGNLQI